MEASENSDGTAESLPMPRALQLRKHRRLQGPQPLHHLADLRLPDAVLDCGTPIAALLAARRRLGLRGTHVALEQRGQSLECASAMAGSSACGEAQAEGVQGVGAVAGAVEEAEVPAQEEAQAQHERGPQGGRATEAQRDQQLGTGRDQRGGGHLALPLVVGVGVLEDRAEDPGMSAELPLHQRVHADVELQALLQQVDAVRDVAAQISRSSGRHLRGDDAEAFHHAARQAAALVAEQWPQRPPQGLANRRRCASAGKHGGEDAASALGEEHTPCGAVPEVEP
mmetsp:Transcript_54807/g.158586  ORF Transcript_54807/g.158586 Transcript_54807/m.158586 type:complete len:283 (-) Transcript_54807:116-964(-)